MATKRGRNLSTMGQAFTPVFTDGSIAVGQPVMVRMQGVPTMPGSRDRPGRWNAFILPLLVAGELIKQFVEKL